MPSPSTTHGPPAEENNVIGDIMSPSPPSSPPQSPSTPQRVSYDDNPLDATKIRKAKEHATPAKGCNSPIKKAGRGCTELTTKHIPFAPAAASIIDPHPATVHPPDPIIVTQSQPQLPTENSEDNDTSTITPMTTKMKQAAVSSSSGAETKSVSRKTSSRIPRKCNCNLSTCNDIRQHYHAVGISYSNYTLLPKSDLAKRIAYAWRLDHLYHFAPWHLETSLRPIMRINTNNGKGFVSTLLLDSTYQDVPHEHFSHINSSVVCALPMNTADHMQRAHEQCNFYCKLVEDEPTLKNEVGLLINGTLKHRKTSLETHQQFDLYTHLDQKQLRDPKFDHTQLNAALATLYVPNEKWDNIIATGTEWSELEKAYST